MKQFELKVCQWCGQTFHGFKNSKYCGKMCYDQLLNAKAAAKRSGQSCKTEDVIYRHIEKMREKAKRKKETLTAVHLTSSSVQWREVKES